MRLLFVVQRYGAEVAGGAELACRLFTEHLAARGHEVSVVTSAARGYVEWADEYPPGTSVEGGVVVHRRPVAHPRPLGLYAALDQRVPWGDRPIALPLQHAWMEMQGPTIAGLERWLRRRARDHDAVVFFTYLYYPAWRGLRAVAGAVPTVLHPCAHEEPMLTLSMFDETLRLPDAWSFFTEEEQALIEGRVRGGAVAPKPSAVTGIGMDLDVVGVGERFRSGFGLGDRPYLLFVGRLDPAKGTEELFDFFVAYRRRRPGSDLALVLVGEQVRGLAEHPDVVCTGFVDEQVKRDAVAGALALAQPSYFESFSMVLTEAWALRRPALVQGACAVLAGQARRSGGAVPFRGYAEFEAAVDLLLERPEVGARLGEAGRAYVEARYPWPVVLDAYEALLTDTIARHPAGRAQLQAVSRSSGWLR